MVAPSALVAAIFCPCGIELRFSAHYAGRVEPFLEKHDRRQPGIDQAHQAAHLVRPLHGDILAAEFPVQPPELLVAKAFSRRLEA